ncbi:3-isopropylmalate dehydratase small subunit [Roseomonas sp. M0104]|uniref:3-isopropylmalate dehydratase small subunit n=1 Tax=Teichococcus coralli TaxID=2545983 RepID=A0A845B9I1_9PROT|nr:3-isopropylmalate dehydratase small subunit [Pseudoroseomonas coralli]MXP64273.1 3-isopropylmalate dehydratase small subunit [Pseudoroseomonas coralli]
MSRQPVTRIEGLAAPFDVSNVDTDQIIPARFLRRPRDTQYGTYLFHDLRFDEAGQERPDFILNRPPFRQAAILVAARAFGVGSSREAAVYALQAYGIRAVVAETFGDIFFGNALKNGLLPVRLPLSTVNALRDAVAASPPARLAIDLEREELVAPDGAKHAFAVPAFARECLLQGQDEIGLTLSFLPQIEQFEARRHTPTV